MRVALVHDWLNGMRGGERVLELMCEMFPTADIFTAFYESEKISPIINSHKVIVSDAQLLPRVRNYYRYLLPLYPLISSNISRKIRNENDIQGYDLIISISHCLAKNIITPRGVPHICYCLSPMRYIWDQFDAYFKGKRVEPIARLAASFLRKWDNAGTTRVTDIIGISNFVADRIKRVSKREAHVVYPPVVTNWLRVDKSIPKLRFIAVNALVPYKNTKSIVEAFRDNELPLCVIGSGPELESLKEIATDNIEFISNLSDEQLADIYCTARAMIFAAEEDFGMTPVEIQASGRPVIALSRGGALETVESRGNNATGLFFDEPTPASINKAIDEFILREAEFDSENCCAKSQEFSVGVFRSGLYNVLAKFGFNDCTSSSIDLDNFRRAA